MRVYIQAMKTRQYGKATATGIHLKKPSARELADAVERADRDGFKVIYVYDTSKTLVDMADMLRDETGLMVGWSNFCQSVDAFLIDDRCIRLPVEA